MDALRYNNICKRIKEKDLIKDISFSVKQGEIFGLLGPNGAGKTTLMKLTVGIMNISSGSIEIMGKDSRIDSKQIINDIGILLEQPAFYPYLSGYDNLFVIAKSLKIPNTRIDEVIEIVGLSDAIYKKSSTYSLGMKQRLGIAIALLKKPKIVILDEPTNGLDPQGIYELRCYLKKLASEHNITILVSSHLLSEMSLLCDRYAIIQSGQLKKVMSQEESEQLLGKGDVVFEIDNTKKAETLLSKENISFETESSDKIILHVDKQQIANVNKIFVNNDISVYGISPKGNSLEDYYFKTIDDEANKDGDI